MTVGLSSRVERERDGLFHYSPNQLDAPERFLDDRFLTVRPPARPPFVHAGDDAKTASNRLPKLVHVSARRADRADAADERLVPGGRGDVGLVDDAQRVGPG